MMAGTVLFTMNPLQMAKGTMFTVWVVTEKWMSLKLLTIRFVILNIMKVILC